MMQDLKEGREEAIEASGEGRFAGLKGTACAKVLRQDWAAHI